MASPAPQPARWYLCIISSLGLCSLYLEGEACWGSALTLNTQRAGCPTSGISIIANPKNSLREASRELCFSGKEN